jgi:pyrroline-5-carboxylate reductase
MPNPTPLVLAGCGKMGGALLDGWLLKGVPAHDIIVVEPSPAIAESLAGRGLGGVYTNPAAIPADIQPTLVVFAVKPQTMDAVVPGYRRFADAGTAFLSIAAGRPIRYFEDTLGRDTAVLRAMPNTPAAVHRGITVVCANARTTATQRALCGELLGAVGAVEWIEDETLMDAVTAVSGSGPAYVFLFVECLARAGADAGLPDDLAMRLARATVAGSGELLARAPEPAATLRTNVTSPGGTTAAALDILMASDGLPRLLARAVAAATRRSRELAG